MAKKTAEQPETTPVETISKTEAVKRALAEGHEYPAEGAAYIKATFGIDITNQQFSTYKSLGKKRDGATPARRGPKPGKKSIGVDNAVSPGEAVNGHRVGNGNAAELARAVKHLVGQYGAEAVREMTGVFE